MMISFVSQRRVKLFIYTLCAFGMCDEGGCFSSPFTNLPLMARSHRHTWINKSVLAGWINNDPRSDHDTDIEALIVSLSNVADDQSRREKLALLFQENLQNQDGGELFMKQFNKAMITVGDRIRGDAVKKAAATMMNQSSNFTNTDKETDLSLIPLPKSQLERQLWACVDMMVQSKALMKQARTK